MAAKKKVKKAPKIKSMGKKVIKKTAAKGGKKTSKKGAAKAGGKS